MKKLFGKNVKETENMYNSEDNKDMMDDMPVYDWSINEEGYFITKLLDYVLNSVSDRDVQRILREVENNDLATVMKGLTAEARAVIFRNLSERMATMIREDMEFMGEVTTKQVGETAQDIMTIIVKLMSLNELPDNEYGIISRMTKIFGVKDKNISLETEAEIESELEILFMNYRKVKNGVIR